MAYSFLAGYFIRSSAAFVPTYGYQLDKANNEGACKLLVINSIIGQI